ncbi:MAG: hypothetical protein L7S62_02545 [Flavobacteriales bacterium]|nr:hypothetical protein [Flavobacteriales bacterium]
MDVFAFFECSFGGLRHLTVWGSSGRTPTVRADRARDKVGYPIQVNHTQNPPVLFKTAIDRQRPCAYLRQMRRFLNICELPLTRLLGNASHLMMLLLKLEAVELLTMS